MSIYITPSVEGFTADKRDTFHGTPGIATAYDSSDTSQVTAYSTAVKVTIFKVSKTHKFTFSATVVVDEIYLIACKQMIISQGDTPNPLAAIVAYVSLTILPAFLALHGFWILPFILTYTCLESDQ